MGGEVAGLHGILDRRQFEDTTSFEATSRIACSLLDAMWNWWPSASEAVVRSLWAPSSLGFVAALLWFIGNKGTRSL